MSKRQNFFLGHLLISVLIALAALALVFFVWYPSPLATAAGVTCIFLMLLVIDVILGPLLGLLVYKEGKKTLKMDLMVIILIQIAALSYGLYSIAQARPVWIAFNHDRFELVRNNELKTENIMHAQAQYQQPTWLQPQYVAVKPADDPQERQIEQMSAMLNGISLAQYPERYIAINQAKTQIQSQVRDLSQLKQWNDEKKIQAVFGQHPQANSWLPLETYGLAMVVLINKEKAEVVKIVDLRPWN
ncbi:type IV pilin accessory protein [Acinetobacter sp. YWS30-1]|uniref:TfpX/TfpZ family type IV pilin accessory protein n=1 Tax=Acinetobacter sp. YWS30-1 TaxID=2996862 RepID=UPI002B25F958|nr:TfpX/TfpZ family type IV pilin accessory protein [Acinetobacter sp. YWS30-1]WPC34567.1 type IV pilin accessory protein [Acinetobacter sp. YWS30-1]